MHGQNHIKIDKWEYEGDKRWNMLLSFQAKF